MMSRVIKVLEGVHMGLGHDGLAKLIEKEAKLDVSKLGKSDLIMCINRYGDKLKLLGCQGRVLGYLKIPGQQRIMKDALQFIPQTFGSGGLDYDSACRKALESRFRKYGQTAPSQTA